MQFNALFCILQIANRKKSIDISKYFDQVQPLVHHRAQLVVEALEKKWSSTQKHLGFTYIYYLEAKWIILMNPNIPNPKYYLTKDGMKVLRLGDGYIIQSAMEIEKIVLYRITHIQNIAHILQNGITHRHLFTLIPII